MNEKYRWSFLTHSVYDGGAGDIGLAIIGSRVRFSPGQLQGNLGQVVHTYVSLSPSSITWYKSNDCEVLRLGR